VESGDPEREAFELAVTAITRKERTTAELSELLVARGVRDDVAQLVLERLAEIGELDDRRFALAYAADKRELRGWGPDRIRAALAERGIDRALAEEAAESESPAEQAERAAELLAERDEHLADDASRGRALAYLARRGFGSEVAYEAVRRAGA
jgi:regulatory protein